MTPHGVRWLAGPAVALLLAVGVLVGLTAASFVTAGGAEPGGRGRPPPPGGWFHGLPAGTWPSLPTGAQCSARVHRSTWEPRPDNFAPNHRMPSREAVRRSLEARPRAVLGAYDPHWDSWLLPRVDGHFTGTTDEILQWAACKWGLPDDLLRAIAVRESNWYQGQVYPDGSCVVAHGCGDLLTGRLPGGRAYCRMLLGTPSPAGAAYSRHECPRTFSIVGVMSWQQPTWGRMPGNQNGTFPFNRDSTAFAVDYLGAFLRGCTEGWTRWLGNTGPYRADDLSGCVGAWYAGAWRSSEALDYVARVAAMRRTRPWLTHSWAREAPPCSGIHGCPLAAP